jgi:RimJ/RimL family protein N-acetyltransferase
VAADSPWPVHTARLTIRPAVAEDAEATWRFRQHPGMNDWVPTRPANLEAYRAHFTDPDRLRKTFVAELDGRVIAELMLNIENAWAHSELAEQGRDAQAELGWLLDPTYGGQGYATEAVAGLIDTCFGPLGVHRVIAICFSANEASLRLMHRLGMRHEGHYLQDSLHRSGEWLDSDLYALLASEWRR